MFSSVRARLTLAATFVVAACLAAAGGCVSKPTQAEQSESAAKPPRPAAPGATPSSASDPSAVSESSTVGAPAASRPATTSDERRAMIDRRLSDSLGTFDAHLRSEQQKIARERDARQSSVVTVAAADSKASTSPGLNRSRSNGNRESGDLRSEKAPGPGAAADAGNGAVANEVPDGSDDDVVARRLRKAAEQETDPELKDKLWKEYVEYKKNTQAK